MTIIVDEIDRSLHPDVTKKIIMDHISNGSSNNTQLIATTHEIGIMNCLDDDEIWFVEKIDGKSSLYSMADFDLKGQSDKISLYVSGRLGAKPKGLR